MDLLAHMPLCASRILFFNMGFTADNRLRWGMWRGLVSFRDISRTLLLCASLFLLWYVVMLLIDWYDIGFHLLATISSAAMVGTGYSWGVIGRITG
ncbi:MAG: hypothetical protein KKD17_00290 [Nanoarchaeota archaeon]|nr:hypothetical protein [Nanoarchaeota archaeon]